MQNAGCALQYHLADVEVDTMDLDAVGGFVRYLDGAGLVDYICVDEVGIDKHEKEIEGG